MIVDGGIEVEIMAFLFCNYLLKRADFAYMLKEDEGFKKVLILLRPDANGILPIERLCF